MKSASIKFKRLNREAGAEGPIAQVLIVFFMSIIVILASLPIIISVLTSLKSKSEVALGVWTLPHAPRFANYLVGLNNMSVNLFNSIIICAVASAGVVLLGSIVSYVFVRHNFPGRDIIFSAIIALMVVPGVLTLTPSYLLMMNLGIKNTWWALILPYISGGQVGAIFLFRTFFSQQPADLFDAAKIDGANDFMMYIHITMPLAVPVLAIQAVTTFAACYNDYLWPVLVIDETSKQTLMPILNALFSQVVQGRDIDQGVVNATYLISGIPLIFTTAFGLKYFINGEFASGLKL